MLGCFRRYNYQLCDKCHKSGNLQRQFLLLYRLSLFQLIKTVKQRFATDMFLFLKLKCLRKVFRKNRIWSKINWTVFIHRINVKWHIFVPGCTWKCLDTILFLKKLKPELGFYIYCARNFKSLKEKYVASKFLRFY